MAFVIKDGRGRFRPVSTKDIPPMTIAEIANPARPVEPDEPLDAAPGLVLCRRHHRPDRRVRMGHAFLRARGAVALACADPDGGQPDGVGPGARDLSAPRPSVRGTGGDRARFPPGCRVVARRPAAGRRPDRHLLPRPLGPGRGPVRRGRGRGPGDDRPDRVLLRRPVRGDDHAGDRLPPAGAGGGHHGRDRDLVGAVRARAYVQIRMRPWSRPCRSRSRPASCWRSPMRSRAICGSRSVSTWAGTMPRATSSAASSPAPTCRTA